MHQRIDAAAAWPAGADAADVLAGVATALGAPWDGPGVPARAGPVEVPAGVPGWEVLDATRAALVAADAVARRRLGAHHTPPPLARRLAALALDGLAPDAVVADPACGGGAFLVGAAEALVAAGGERRRIVERQLCGADVDPLAVATTRAALALWAGDATGAAGVVVADGLGSWRPPGSVDAVVGNPPFASPLTTPDGAHPGGEARAGRRGRAGRGHHHPERRGSGPYTDLAGRFLLAALDLVRPGGTVLLVQPESVLAARDAAPVRAAVAAAGLAGIWFAGGHVFDADVDTCAVLVRSGSRPRRTVRRWEGPDARPAGSTTVDGAAPTWAHLRPGAPAPRPAPGAGTVGDLAEARAGFRDEFYAIAAATTEGGAQAVVTSGLVDPGRVRWGERPARIGGRRFERPGVDPHDLDGRVAAWVRARLAPKVLVATQTRVLEAAADPWGRFVPLTPVLSVHPHDPADVWRIAAALTAPAATAWALHHYGGTALHREAVKLSARQVLDVPLPGDLGAWEAAADALAAGDVDTCAGALAHGEADLLAWWRARRPPPPAPDGV